MHLSRNFLYGKRKYVFGSILLLFISIMCVVLRMEDTDNFDISRREVLLRRIGHELLLQSGDSASRVLPVEKTAENEYRIRFENNLTFQPDSRVNITRRLLARDPLKGDYVVNVLNCGDARVVYGYAISKDRKDDIITCIGRKQPTACYMINVKFKMLSVNTAKSWILLGSLPCLAFVGFLFFDLVSQKQLYLRRVRIRI